MTEAPPDRFRLHRALKTHSPRPMAASPNVSIFPSPNSFPVLVLVLVLVILLSLVPSASPSPAPLSAGTGGWALNLNGRRTAESPGEIVTPTLLDLNSPLVSGVSYTFAFRSPAEMKVPGCGPDMEGSMLGLEVNSPDFEASNVLSSVDIYGIMTFGGLGLSLPGPAPILMSSALGWHYVGFSLDKAAGKVLYTFDDFWQESRDVDLSWLTNLEPGTEVPIKLRLGRNFQNSQGFQGLYDNVCVRAEPMDSEALVSQAVSAVKCSEGSAQVLNFLFDSDRDHHQQPSIFDSVSNLFLGQATTTDERGYFDEHVFHAPADGSSLDGGELVVRCSANPCVVDLAGVDCEKFVVKSLPAPSEGELAVGVTVQSAAPFDVGLSDTLTFTPADGASYPKTFTYACVSSFAEGSPATVTLQANREPIVGGGINALANTLMSGSATVGVATSFGDFDKDGDTLEVEVKVSSEEPCVGFRFFQVLPDETYLDIVKSYNEEYGCDDDGYECTGILPTVPAKADSYDGYALRFYSSMLYFGFNKDSEYPAWDFKEITADMSEWVTLDDPYHRFIMVWEGEFDPDFSCALVYHTYDGDQYSNEGEIPIKLVPPPHLPFITPFNVASVEDYDVHITIEPEGVSDYETMLLTISSMPVSQDDEETLGGQLFHEDGTEVVMTQDSATIVQFVVGGEASSYWESDGYRFDEIFGEPNVWPLFGDFLGSWCPSQEGDFINQWLIFEFETPVYATSLGIYETWLPFGVMEVLAQDSEWVEEEGVEEAPWISIWKRAPDSVPYVSPKDKMSYLDEIALCPVSFKTQRIKAIVQLRSSAHWYSIDAVSLAGVEVRGGNVLKGTTFTFKPFANVHGWFDVAVRVMDCEFFLKARETKADERTGVVSLNVVSENDSPVFFEEETKLVVGVFEDTDLQLLDYVLDNDVLMEDEDDSLTFTISELQASYSEYGRFFYDGEELEVGKSTVIRDVVKSDVKSGVLVFKPASALLKRDYKVFEPFSFNLKAEDEHGKSVSQMVTVVLSEERICSTEDFSYTIGDCDGGGMRLQHFFWIDSETKEESSFDDIRCVIVAAELPKNTLYDCDHVDLATSSGAVIIAFSAIGAILCSMCFALVTRHRQKPIMKMSQPVFLQLSCVGAVFLCLTNLGNIGRNTDFTCMMRVFIWNPSFTLMVAPLISKTYRIYGIMGNKTLKKVKITNARVFAEIGANVAFDIIFCIIWWFVDPVKRVDSPDPNYPDIVSSSCKTKTPYFGAVITVAKCGFLIVGCNISWKTRNMNPALAEAKFIALALYQIALLGIVALLLGALGVSSSANQTVIALCDVVGSIGMVALVILPKLLRLEDTQTMLTSSSNSTSNATSLHTPPGSADAEGVSKDAIKLAKAIVEITEREREINELKSALEDLKELAKDLETENNQIKAQQASQGRRPSFLSGGSSVAPAG